MVTVRKRRGVVLEINGTDMVLLTPEGEFVKRPITGSSVVLGQEVQYCEKIEAVNPPKQGFLTKWRRSGLAVAAVLLMLILTPAVLNLLPVNAETVAYVTIDTIDVNPSIELAIDSKDAVVSADGLNDEGKEIVKSLDLSGKSSELATALIAKKMVELGFIKRDEDATLMITVRPVKSGNQVATKLEKKLAASTREALAKDDVKFVVVQTALIDDQLRLSAQQTGISPGKYWFMLNEGELGVEPKNEVLLDPEIEIGNIITGGNEGNNSPENNTEQPSDPGDARVEIALAPDITSGKNDDSGAKAVAPKNSKDIDTLDEKAIIDMLLAQLEANNIEASNEIALLDEDAEKIEKLKEIIDRLNLEEVLETLDEKPLEEPTKNE